MMFHLKEQAVENAINDGISLEQTTIERSGDGKTANLQMVICVANWAYEKEVFCRMSFNEWNSFTDFRAKYQYTSLDDAVDFFVCDIECELSSPHAEFAVACIQNEEYYWDNDDWRNYIINTETGEKEEATHFIFSTPEDSDPVLVSEEVVACERSVQNAEFSPDFVSPETSSQTESQKEENPALSDDAADTQKTEEENSTTQEASEEKKSLGSNISEENPVTPKKKQKKKGFFSALNCASNKRK